MIIKERRMKGTYSVWSVSIPISNHCRQYKTNRQTFFKIVLYCTWKERNSKQPVLRNPFHLSSGAVAIAIPANPPTGSHRSVWANKWFSKRRCGFIDCRLLHDSCILAANDSVSVYLPSQPKAQLMVILSNTWSDRITLASCWGKVERGRARCRWRICERVNWDTLQWRRGSRVC